jgi:CBS domain-containing protein
MTIGSVCNREVVVVQPAESLRAAAQLMRTFNTGSVVVCEALRGHRVPVGIITDRDVMLAVLREGPDLDRVLVSQAMTREPIVLKDSDSVSDALMRMRAHRVRRAPVTDADGALIGIVAVDDLLDVLVGQLQSIVRLIQQQAEPLVPRGTLPL